MVAVILTNQYYGEVLATTIKHEKKMSVNKDVAWSLKQKKGKQKAKGNQFTW